jgi:hypothetical protein
MHRAWTPAFFKALRKQYPEKYGETTYREAFYEWVNSYQAVWPSYLREPDSDQVKVDDVKMKAAISVYQILEFSFDPENKARLIQWVADAISNNKLLYSSPLNLDYKVLLKQLKKDMAAKEEQQQAGMDPEDPRPEIPKVKMSRADSAIDREKVVELLEHIRASKIP